MDNCRFFPFALLFACILLMLQTACAPCTTMDGMEKLLLHSPQAFNDIARDFLSQSRIHGLSIDVFRKGQHESVNTWFFYPGHDTQWKSWDRKAACAIYLPGRDEVLRREAIDPRQYSKFAAFLQEFRVHSLSRVSPKSAEFENNLVGLRFEQDPGAVFTADAEYLQVKKLNAHWYVYYRDWN